MISCRNNEEDWGVGVGVGWRGWCVGGTLKDRRREGRMQKRGLKNGRKKERYKKEMSMVVINWNLSPVNHT